MPAPREGSRKRQVYDVFVAKGLEAAMKVGASLELKAGTVKSWAGGWSKTASAPKPTTKAEANGFTPHFDYDSRAKAERVANEKAKRTGMDPDCLVVCERNGKFAIIPRHHAAEYGVPVEPGVFAKGNTVKDRSRPGREGTVLQGGPQVSEVQWDDGAKQYVTNDYLVHVERKAAPPKVKSGGRVSKPEPKQVKKEPAKSDKSGWDRLRKAGKENTAKTEASKQKKSKRGR